MNAVQTLAAGLLVVCGLWLLVVQDWRHGLAVLALQYAGAALLVAQSWPPLMALVKGLAGWMAVLILLTAARARRPDIRYAAAGVGGQAFRLLTAALVLLAALSLLPPLVQAVPGMRPLALLGAMWLVGSGLLQMGFSLHPLRAVMAWLTALTGFEIAYAAVERSVLMAALLALLHLALALAGAYLLLLPEEAQP